MPGVAKIPQFFGFGDYLSHRPIIPLRQFSPIRIEAEFGQTPFRGVKPDDSLSNLMPLLCQNDST